MANLFFGKTVEEIGSAKEAWEVFRDGCALRSRVAVTRQVELELQMIFYAGIITGLGMQHRGADAEALSAEVLMWLGRNCDAVPH